MSKAVCISQYQLDYIQCKPSRLRKCEEQDKKCMDQSDHCCNGNCSTVSLVHVETSFPPGYDGLTHSGGQTYSNSGQSRLAGNELSPADGQVAEIRRTLQRLEMRLEGRYNRQSHDASIAGEWKAVATVMDRFFFYFYICLIVTSVIVFFPRPWTNRIFRLLIHQDYKWQREDLRIDTANHINITKHRLNMKGDQIDKKISHYTADPNSVVNELSSCLRYQR